RPYACGYLGAHVSEATNVATGDAPLKRGMGGAGAPSAGAVGTPAPQRQGSGARTPQQIQNAKLPWRRDGPHRTRRATARARVGTAHPQGSEGSGASESGAPPVGSGTADARLPCHDARHTTDYTATSWPLGILVEAMSTGSSALPQEG